MERPPTYRLISIITLILIVIMVSINATSLLSYPAPHCDEAGSGAMGFSLITSGTPTFLFMGEFSTVSNALVGRFYHGLLGMALVVFGSSLLTARLVSFVGFLVSIALVAVIGKTTWGRWFEGLIAALFFTASLNVFWASHIARPEMWLIVLGLISLLAFLAWQRQSDPVPGYDVLLAAWLALSSLLNHPNGAFFSAALGLMMVLHFYREKRSPGRWALLILGFGIGAALLAGLHMATTRTGSLQMISATTSHHCGTPFCLPTVADLFNLRDGYVVTHLRATLRFLNIAFVANFNHAVIPFGLYSSAAIIAGFWSPRPEVKRLMAYSALSFALFVLVTPYKSQFYVPMWDGPLALLMAGAVSLIAGKLAEWDGPPALRRYDLVSLGMALPLVLVYAAGTAWLSYKFSERDFNALAAQIEAVIEPGSRVMGNAEFWYPLGQQGEFISDWYLLSLPSITSYDEPVVDQTAEILDQLGIDYVIDSGVLSCSVVPTAAYEQYHYQLVQTCQPVAVFEDRWLGAYGQNGQSTGTTVYQCR